MTGDDQRVETALSREGRSPSAGPEPQRLSLREHMERKLRTRREQAIDAKRGQTVEPMFGQIKPLQGVGPFPCRGLGACDSE